MPIRTVIVEDEPLSRAFLYNLLSEYCPNVEVLADVPTAAQAIETINRLRPDLVFMDIELQQGTGFDVLRATQECKYHVIFTTAIEHYGILAIKFSGVDYLQKPIDIQGLQACIQNIGNESLQSSCAGIRHLVETLENNNIPKHLVVNVSGQSIFLLINDIISIEATGDECIIRIDKNAPAISTGRSIKDYEQLLHEYRFLRVHHAFIINTRQVENFTMLNLGEVQMKDKSVVPVSVKKMAELRAMFA